MKTKASDPLLNKLRDLLVDPWRLLKQHDSMTITDLRFAVKRAEENLAEALELIEKARRIHGR